MQMQGQEWEKGNQNQVKGQGKVMQLPDIIKKQEGLEKK